MLVGLLLYAYCTGQRSSRLIERRCIEDLGLRVLAGGLCPDHATIARFRSRHAQALAGVLVAATERNPQAWTTPSTLPERQNQQVRSQP